MLLLQVFFYLVLLATFDLFYLMGFAYFL
jgi:hypothetical protein